MMELLPYKELPCDNVDEIAADAWQFLSDKTDLMGRNMDVDFSWNFFNPRDLITNVPSLNDWFRSMDLKLRDIAVTICRTKQGLGPHRDEPPVVAKINFPVLNTEDTYNVWWDDANNEVGRIVMRKPLAFNASMLHAVEMGDNCKYPRVILSCMFFNEPLHLLRVP